MNDKQDYRKRLAPIRCFLLDMDGTFYLGNQLLCGSLEFLEKVKSTGRQVLFLTNNSSKSAEVYIEKLRRMGVHDPFLHVLTSGQAAGRYALRTYPGESAYILGTEMLRREMEDMGIIIEEQTPDYVMIGYDTTLDYAKMSKVCDLVRAGLPYIATHPDFNCPTETGCVPDIGAIIAFIEASTKRSPDIVIGKPNLGIVEEAKRVTGCCADQMAMVGDRLYTDIAMSARHGLLGILVLTGEATRNDIVKSPDQPDLVVDRLSDMIEYL